MGREGWEQLEAAAVEEGRPGPGAAAAGAPRGPGRAEPGQGRRRGKGGQTSEEGSGNLSETVVSRGGGWGRQRRERTDRSPFRGRSGRTDERPEATDAEPRAREPASDTGRTGAGLR